MPDKATRLVVLDRVKAFFEDRVGKNCFIAYCCDKAITNTKAGTVACDVCGRKFTLEPLDVWYERLAKPLRQSMN